MRLCLFNQTLYKSDDYIVQQNWRYRWLAQPDGTIHSRINLHAPYKPSLTYMPPMIELCNVEDGNYLMLGLGGGALLHALSHKLNTSSIDVVEINPEIISIARRYFYLDSFKSITVFKEDAQHYISRCKKQYDAILIDIYQDKSYPKHCATLSFFQTCQKLIKQNGIIVINCANMSQYPILLNQLRNIFNQSVLTIRVSNPNNVILVSAHEPIKSLLDKITLKKLGWHENTGLVGDYK